MQSSCLQFETPSPPLQPAVFAPSLREPPPPAVDLFDLDDCFASPSIRLSHLTNKVHHLSLLNLLLVNERIPKHYISDDR